MNDEGSECSLHAKRMQIGFFRHGCICEKQYDIHEKNNDSTLILILFLLPYLKIH